MKDSLIDLGTLLLVLTSMFLKSAIRVLIVMGVLWLIGVLFPHVASALGVPRDTLYGFVTFILEQSGNLLQRIVRGSMASPVYTALTIR